MKKQDFIRKIESAKRYADKSNEILQEVLFTLEDEGINLEVNSNAPNADTLEEAITCFVGYGEYTSQEIWEEIKANRKGEA